MIKAFLYIITCKASGKRYIGITSTKLEYRWKQHIYDAGRTSTIPLGKAIREYGPDNFTKKILIITTQEEAIRLEPLAIKAFDTMAPNGYNLRDGGGVHSIHSDTRVRISQSLVGRMKGVPKSLEHRLKIGIGNRGKVRSAETRALYSSLRKAGSYL